MTVEKFNDFLQKTHLRCNYSGREIYDEGFFCIGNGWYELVQDLIDELIAAGWDRNLDCVKEKFGVLRVYITNGNNELWDIINKYETASASICENCGGDGKLRNRSWLKTLCDSCDQNV